MAQLDSYMDRLDRKLDRLRAIVSNPRLFISEHFFSIRNQIDIRAEEILLSKKLSKQEADQVNRLRVLFLEKLTSHEKFCLNEFEKHLNRNESDERSISYFKRALNRDFDFQSQISGPKDFRTYYLYLNRLFDELIAFLMRNKFIFFNTSLVIVPKPTSPSSTPKKPEPVHNPYNLGYLFILDLDDLVLCRNARKLLK